MILHNNFVQTFEYLKFMLRKDFVDIQNLFLLLSLHLKYVIKLLAIIYIFAHILQILNPFLQVFQLQTTLIKGFFDWHNECENIVGDHLLHFEWHVLFQIVISGHKLLEIVFASQPYCLIIVFLLFSVRFK